MRKPLKDMTLVRTELWIEVLELACARNEEYGYDCSEYEQLLAEARTQLLSREKNDD